MWRDVASWIDAATGQTSGTGFGIWNAWGNSGGGYIAPWHYQWNAAWGYLWFNDLGLYYVHGRWYNPDTGMWLAPNVNQSAVKPAAWQGFLASFYGGIDEEILMRLLLLSLFAFLGRFVSHTAEGRPTLAVLWIVNILVAIIFGLGHLPATSLLVPITPLIVVRAIVLNGLVGLVCGYLYFTRGLESAMLLHFSADIVLHVIFAL